MEAVIKKQGYILSRKMGRLLDEYNLNKFAKENAARLQALRQAVGFINPFAYRGISREPLAPWSPEDKDEVNELSARKQMYEFIAQSGDEWNVPEESIIATLDQAQEIRGSLVAPDEYEIVQISLENFEQQFEPLGFDIGFWGGDFFSLICDSVIMPRWHPPDPADFAALGLKLKNLNGNILFNTYGEATEFKKYYQSKNWAETEMYEGEFCIIHLALPES
jgi:hypothetical protein